MSDTVCACQGLSGVDLHYKLPHKLTHSPARSKNCGFAVVFILLGFVSYIFGFLERLFLCVHIV